MTRASWRDGGRPIDLVYNRLVDFALEEPRHAALQAAYVGGSVVLTPNPRAHALFADKRNLTLLSDADSLKRWGLAQNHLDVLRASVPTTVVVSPDDADALWRDRRNLFFKPARGHGSKAAYRGDKVTRKVWAEIISGEYVAQSYAAPGTRGVQLDETRAELKIDVRLYTFAGTILLAAARLYQGQDHQHAHARRRIRSSAGGSRAAQGFVMSAGVTPHVRRC